jgi:hypothetical protein
MTTDEMSSAAMKTRLAELEKQYGEMPS